MFKKISNGLKKINLIALTAIVGIALSSLSPLAYAIENSPMPSAAALAQNNSGSVEDLLVQLRKDKTDFETNKLAEETAQTGSLKEKTAAKRQAALARAEAAKKTKDEKRKAVLTRLLDIQIKQLENTKERVIKMSNIAQVLRDQIIAAIGDTNVSNSAIGVLTAKKKEVLAATTGEQLKKLAKDIKDLFKSKRDIVKQIVDAILASKTDNAITVAEGRLSDMTAKIAALKAAGQNTTASEVLLATVQSKIADAKTKAGKEDLKTAISDLKDAYNSMKNILEKTGSAE